MKKLSLALPEVLTTAEVAAIFRVQPATVVKWARAGKIPSGRVGRGNLRFLRADVEAFLNGGRS